MMEKYTDFTKFRTESDIKLAKATLRHRSVLQERAIANAFQDFGVHLLNSLKLAAIQLGSSILTAALIRMIRSRSK